MRGKPDSFNSISVNISSPTTIQLNFTQKTSNFFLTVEKNEFLTKTKKWKFHKKSFERSIILTVKHLYELDVVVMKN